MSSLDADKRFRDLYDRYYRAVVAYLMRFGFSREDARDLAQDVFLRVYQHWDEYRGESEWTYLKTIALRIALNEIRRRMAIARNAKEVSLEERPWLAESIPSPSQTPIDGALADRQQLAWRRRWLRDAISELPEGTRRCVEFWLAGNKYHEIMKILNITMDAVKSRLHDARKRLTVLLAEKQEGIEWPDGFGEDDHDQEK